MSKKEGKDKINELQTNSNEDQWKFQSILLTSAAIALRAISFNYTNVLKNRIELTSTTYSFEYLKDGISIYKDGFDPYLSNNFNFTPILLHLFAFILDNIPSILIPLFISVDIATSWILAKSVQKYLKNRDGEKSENIERIVFCIYAFNPITIVSVGIFSITVLQNFVMALIVYTFLNNFASFCASLIGFWASFTLYPAVILPSLIYCSNNSVLRFLTLLAISISTFLMTNSINFWLNGNNLDWVENCYTVILKFENIQPNVGLTWYFFVQIFDHFLYFFYVAFTVLFFFMPIPICLNMRKDAALYFTTCLLLASIFFPYPTLNQVSVIFAILPLHNRYQKYTRFTLLITGTIISTITLMPVMWHMWIVSSSGNANFFFGATTFYNMALIYIVIEFIFIYARKLIDDEYPDAVKKDVKFEFLFY